MKLGTSSLVVAAFVGPGTVLTCATAGYRFGYDLGWVLLFATAAAFVLQSLTAGTGLLAGRGLGEALREAATSRLQRALVFTLVVLGLWIGCAAFELGNLLGAASGLQAVLSPSLDIRWLVLALGGAAAVLLALDVRALTRALAVLVGLMSTLFVVTLVLAPVDWSAALRGLVVPTVPDDGLLVVVALIGTTIVTYNLFLHPSAAKAYWETTPPDEAWRRELRGMLVFLPLGGLISFAILASAAALRGSGVEATQAADFAALLEPAAGPAARVLFGLGLFAAGLTSAVTAPLAAAAGIRELFGWPAADRRTRLVWASVLVTGIGCGLTGISPLPAIVAAQAANGILLPVIAAFVLVLTLRQDAVRLPRWYVAAGAVVTLVCGLLGARTLWWVWTQV